MSTSREAAIVRYLCEKLKPVWNKRCQTRILSPGDMPQRSIAVAPLGLRREPAGAAGGTFQRYTFTLAVFVCSRMVSDTDTTDAIADCLDDVRDVMTALYAAISPAELTAGSLNVETFRRGPIEYWFDGGDSAGQKVGGLITIEADWKEQG